MILRALTLGTAVAFSVIAGSTAPQPAAAASVQQDLADARSVLNESISAVYSVRSDDNFKQNFERYLMRAKGVLIVPEFFKGGFIVGRRLRQWLGHEPRPHRRMVSPRLLPHERRILGTSNRRAAIRHGVSHHD